MPRSPSVAEETPNGAAPPSVEVSMSPTPPKQGAVALPVFLGKKGIEAPSGISADLLARRGFEAKPCQTLVLPGSPTRVLVGLGDASALSADTLRLAAGAAMKAAWTESALALDLIDSLPSKLDRGRAAQALVEGALLATYSFGTYKSAPKPCKVRSVTITGRGGRLVAQGIERGQLIFEAVRLARDLVNEPPGGKTPTDLAGVASTIAEGSSLSLTVWDEHDIERERLGGLRGVSLGSAQPPRLIKFVYEPEGVVRRGKDRTPTLALVGKGITFDSGGLSLKPPDGMVTMKCDMSGAAVVLGVMSVVERLAPACRVVGYCCVTENLPGPSAIKPGDVLRARNGKTIEVLNTDAEGRLVLADGLSLAVEDGVDAIVDIATLTGAMVVALGKEITGYFSNNDAFAAQLDAASVRAGEPAWRMPLPGAYRKHIDSEVADMKNMGAAGQAGSIAAALFLQEFVDGVPWVHLDIAGTGWADAPDTITSKGGTAASLRTLVELMATFEKP